MEILAAAVCGFLIDLLAGDPEWFPHPVVLMGKVIAKLETILREVFPSDPEGERKAGLLMAILLPVGTLAVSALILWLCGLFHPAVRFAVEVLWSWQVLAMCCLRKESMRVYQRLIKGSLREARKAIARIVGRDTQELDEDGITRAAVETVAENFSDGEIAPLFWLLVGGAPLALCYKSINTMDSMVGYKNEKYIHFGRAAAKLDDAANWIPSRLAALLLIGAAFLSGRNGGNAWKIWKRDRRNHASPNSAQTESAMAGALEIELAGPASYFGVLHDKPYIGDPIREIEPEDIRRANNLMYLAGCIGLVVFGLLHAAVVCMFFL